MRSRRNWGPGASPTRFARGSLPPSDPGDEWMAIAVRARFPKLAAALGDQLFRMMLASFMAEERDPRRVLTAMPEYLTETPEYPVWYGELAMLDRAHVTVMQARSVTKLTRRDLTQERELKLVPAHAIVQLTTTVDELWGTLDDAAASCTRARASRPRSLDWPRTVLIWRYEGMEIRDRTVDLDEAAALRAAARGTSLVELAAGIGGANPHARALDMVLGWIDSGALGGE